MTVAVELVSFLVGFGIVIATVLSAIRTIVLPRSVRSRLTGLVFRSSGRVFRTFAGGAYERRDRIMAMFAPVTLVALAGVWVGLVSIGYAAMFWSLGYGGWSESWWVSGSSITTLGSAPVTTSAHRTLAATEAVIGLGLVALLIAFLPSLYAAFARREQLVALLEVRAGSPPTATEMLVRFHRIGLVSHLTDEWQRWETWFVDLDESHTSYPSLVWLRSPQPHRSWITAAGTVLDGAAMWIAAVDVPRDPYAALCIRSGFVALRRIADFFGIPHPPDPAPDDPISISRAEFDDAVATLAAGGVPVVGDLDQAWRDFAGWRVNYDAVLLSLAELVMAPYAPWTSDRSAPDHRQPHVSRWGVTSRRYER